MCLDLHAISFLSLIFVLFGQENLKIVLVLVCPSQIIAFEWLYVVFV